jgi:hypothetical protein
LNKTIVHVVGARPNYMKIAPLMEALRSTGVRQLLVNTGQHYDGAMAGLHPRASTPVPDRDRRALGVARSPDCQRHDSVRGGVRGKNAPDRSSWLAT